MIDVDDRDTARLEELREQPELSGEIGFETGMIVEMIARDVGECRRRDAPDAVVRW